MDKPFKTIDEQIDILKARGLQVDNRTRGILEREGYYPVINGYKDPFLLGLPNGQRSDSFEDGVSFGDLYRLFQFDRDLRLTMFARFAKAEATFKTVCSYVFAENNQDIGDAYLIHDRYSDEEWCQDKIDDLIADLKKIIGYRDDGNLYTKRQYIEHYVTRHDNVPIWVLANYLSLGQMFKFYCFQKEAIRNGIAKAFSDIYEETHARSLRISQRRLRLAFDHIKDFRNICAHDERLYCARVSPSKDVNLLGVFRDLAIVLTSSEYQALVQEAVNLMLDLHNNLGSRYSKKVFDAMGIPEMNILISTLD